MSGFIGGMIFSAIGFAAFIYGKKMNQYRTMIIGFLLIGYSCVVSSDLWVYIIGVVLSVSLFLFRE